MKKKKVLFGAVDIGWRIEHYSKFILENYSNQLNSESFVHYKISESHYRTDYTYELNYSDYGNLKRWVLSFFMFLKFLVKYDVFHFFSGETLLTRKTRRMEFWIYKLFKKRIVMHFVGTDIRSHNHIFKRLKNIESIVSGAEITVNPESWQKKLIRDSKKFADAVIVSTPDLIKVYNAEVTYIPVFLDFEKLRAELAKISVKKDKSKIRILHAPSNRTTKGTDLIEKVLKEIQLEEIEGLEIILPNAQEYEMSNYSLSRYDLFKLMKESDIVIDQLIIGWYGLQAIEAIMCDNLVLSYIQSDLEKYRDRVCPLMNVNVLNLKVKILEAIDLIRKGKFDFQKAKEWAERYHNIDNYKGQFENAWGLR